ncbi:hypothetical protein MP228_009541 [Amoeboaphelidium protococcarum]|nr:hypothetical protein MP228_009541 [Amoeboaphelidium protococcarum]
MIDKLLELLGSELTRFMRPIDMFELSLTQKYIQQYLHQDKVSVRASYYAYYGPALTAYLVKDHGWLQLQTHDDYKFFVDASIKNHQVFRKYLCDNILKEEYEFEECPGLVDVLYETFDIDQNSIPDGYRDDRDDNDDDVDDGRQNRELITLFQNGFWSQYDDGQYNELIICRPLDYARCLIQHFMESIYDGADPNVSYKDLSYGFIQDVLYENGLEVMVGELIQRNAAADIEIDGVRTFYISLTAAIEVFSEQVCPLYRKGSLKEKCIEAMLKNASWKGHDLVVELFEPDNFNSPHNEDLFDGESSLPAIERNELPFKLAKAMVSHSNYDYSYARYQILQNERSEWYRSRRGRELSEDERNQRFVKARKFIAPLHPRFKDALKDVTYEEFDRQAWQVDTADLMQVESRINVIVSILHYYGKLYSGDSYLVRLLGQCVSCDDSQRIYVTNADVMYQFFSVLYKCYQEETDKSSVGLEQFDLYLFSDDDQCYDVLREVIALVIQFQEFDMGNFILDQFHDVFLSLMPEYGSYLRQDLMLAGSVYFDGRCTCNCMDSTCLVFGDHGKVGEFLFDGAHGFEYIVKCLDAEVAKYLSPCVLCQSLKKLQLHLPKELEKAVVSVLSNCFPQPERIAAFLRAMQHYDLPVELAVNLLKRLRPDGIIDIASSCGLEIQTLFGVIAGNSPTQPDACVQVNSAQLVILVNQFEKLASEESSYPDSWTRSMYRIKHIFTVLCQQLIAISQKFGERSMITESFASDFLVNPNFLNWAFESGQTYKFGLTGLDEMTRLKWLFIALIEKCWILCPQSLQQMVDHIGEDSLPFGLDTMSEFYRSTREWAADVVKCVKENENVDILLDDSIDERDNVEFVFYQ